MPRLDFETPNPPDRIGQYPILGRLATGGMGDLYLAQHPSLPRKVVLKTVKAGFADDNTTALERFKREALLQSKLEHKHICPVFDVVTAGERTFVVMPFIEGETLAVRVQRAAKAVHDGAPASVGWATIAGLSPDSNPTLPKTPQVDSSKSPAAGDVRAVLRTVEEIARAIHYAHEAGVIHRDLKPGNIMIKKDGEPVVLDFGIALDLEATQMRLTIDGETLGTPLYMSPEQVLGHTGTYGRTTDVYALGVILYELLTFRLPYKADSVKALYRKILEGNAPSPRKLNHSIRDDLAAVCQKAMEVDPRRRYSTALEFAEDLRRVRVLEPTVAKPPSVFGRLSRQARRNPTAAGALALALLLAIGGVWIRYSWDRSVVKSMEYVSAFERVRVATAEGKIPTRQDKELVWGVLSDEKTREVFLANPNSPEAFDLYTNRVQKMFRGPADENTTVAARWPRGGITDTHPVFSFVASSPARTPAELKVTLYSITDEAEVPVGPLKASSHDATLFTATLLAGYPLKIGHKYVWTVSEMAKNGGSPATLARSNFHVVDSATIDKLLSSQRVTGDSALDHLTRTASLLTMDLATEALKELSQLPSNTTESQRKQSILFRARAKAILGEEDEVRKLQTEYLESK